MAINTGAMSVVDYAMFFSLECDTDDSFELFLLDFAVLDPNADRTVLTLSATFTIGGEQQKTSVVFPLELESVAEPATPTDPANGYAPLLVIQLHPQIRLHLPIRPRPQTRLRLRMTSPSAIPPGTWTATANSPPPTPVWRCGPP